MANDELSRIHTTSDRVYVYLKNDEKYKDNDEALISRFWHDEVIRLNGNPNTMTAIQFLTLYANKKLTDAETIVRSRRLVQKNHPELRGHLWNSRHSEEKQVRQYISQ